MTPILGNGLLGSGRTVETTSGPSTLSTITGYHSNSDWHVSLNRRPTLYLHTQTPLPCVWRYQSGGSFHTDCSAKKVQIASDHNPSTSATHRRLPVQFYWRSERTHASPSFRLNDPDLHCERNQHRALAAQPPRHLTLPSHP